MNNTKLFFQFVGSPTCFILLRIMNKFRFFPVYSFSIPQEPPQGRTSCHLSFERDTAIDTWLTSKIVAKVSQRALG